MMISYRTADLLNTFKYGHVEIVIVAMVGLSTVNPTQRFFVKFDRPECEDEALRERFDEKLRGILQAKSYVKEGDHFILSGFATREAAESSFMDVLKMMKHDNSIISTAMDPFEWIEGSGVKRFVLRIRTRGLTR